ncbi:hypothetical protein D5272_00615 [bacterium D16-76]|nr:hypothetical protein [bacterium D16-76]
MAFILLAAALVYLPFLAMLVVRQWPGPVSFVLFYFPPFTTIPLAAFGLGAAAGKNARRYGYVPVRFPSSFPSAHTARFALWKCYLRCWAYIFCWGQAGCWAAILFGNLLV